MEHDYWEEKLHGFLDNELDPADRAAVKEHVDACEACEAHLTYFASMKRRLKTHAETIEAPQCVLDRLKVNFLRKKRPIQRAWFPAAGLALAAAVLLAIFLSFQFQRSSHFVERVIQGLVVCHDCEVAGKARVPKGSLCKDGHRLGLATEDGRLWRFASDEEGMKYIKNFDLLGKEVKIYGQILTANPMIRIKKLEALSQRG